MRASTHVKICRLLTTYRMPYTQQYTDPEKFSFSCVFFTLFFNVFLFTLMKKTFLVDKILILKYFPEKITRPYFYLDHQRKVHHKYWNTDTKRYLLTWTGSLSWLQYSVCHYSLCHQKHEQDSDEVQHVYELDQGKYDHHFC